MSTSDWHKVSRRALACDWGRLIYDADDTALCAADAVQRIALHGALAPALVQLCGPHRDTVMAKTDPHAAADETAVA